MKGVLVGADSASIALVPESSPPLGAGQLVVPTASVGRFELHTGSKRHWLQGLIAGLAVGVAVGLTADVDSVACNSADSYFGGSSGYYCSRGEAIAISMTATGGLGAGVGALVKTDRWTPVALDALAPPPARVSGVVPHLRARPGGGAELGLTIGF